MRRVSMLAIGGWTTATAVATFVSWAGVGAVTRAITTSPEPVLSPAHVVTAARETPVTSAPDAPALPVTATTPATSTTVGSGSSPNGHNVLSIPDSSSTTTTMPGSSPSTSPSGSSGSPTKPDQLAGATATATTTTVPTSAPATFSTAGGQATMTCRGTAITLQSALPAAGYQVSVYQDDPEWLEVTFSRSGATDQIVAYCFDGQPVRNTTGSTTTTTTSTTTTSTIPATTTTQAASESAGSPAKHGEADG